MAFTATPLPIWGGLECTINRVCDRFQDQFELGNVYAQPNHEAIARLGIEKLRFPVLWERHQPMPDGEIDWRFTDQQLSYYRNQQIDVIATLVHHGSGPAHTSLLDPLFPELLAAYAAKVAGRFPWLEYYTPVNEPLTTARFSGLYGLWYPHHTSAKSFLQCLFNQLKGVVLSMRAIRAINPRAKLVQTEDLGKVYSTPALSYQAKFENERRWLTYDVLSGRFDSKHPLWNYAVGEGIPEEELSWFLENHSTPEYFGFNYYITSERFLDERLHLYPGVLAGGNGRDRYVDVEAARLPHGAPSGVEVLLREAWERFGQPLVLTEVHLHCHREDQLRWFRQVYESCTKLRDEGVDIRAVTAWALLGSFGWNRLLTGPSFDYEPGAFDLRGGKARPTALAQFIENRAIPAAPFLDAPGWWQRTRRFFPQCVPDAASLAHEGERTEQPILVIGKRGTLGRALERVCRERALAVVMAGREDCDITDADSVMAALLRYQPWAVINAAGYVRVDEAEADADRCFNENHLGPVNLATACGKLGIPLVSFSSDLVFNGRKNAPYVESDVPSPLNVYGESKARAERDVLAVHPQTLMIRTSAFFGPWDRYHFLYWVEESLRSGNRVPVADDVYVSPTYVPDLVHQTLDLLIDGESGIWHLANEGQFTWAELAQLVAREDGLDSHLIDAMPAAKMGWPARRPRNSVLRSEKAPLLPGTDNALNRYFAERTRNVELMHT